MKHIFCCITDSHYKYIPIEIFAQTYLQQMYCKYQFVVCSEPFNIGNTSHIMMQRDALVLNE
jgi:predicted GNAT family N-acyltransferase